ncbi:LysR family transcriptional regulator [Dickeya sp. CFBP 2040]|uniref:LysR family transcriptional regulator n=1 Tax=Dickeya sp. CFBP 2040 TaxID=2718531 RepID=UPI001444A4DD|nr:LysR family transcriptional regulator [Dickeya sp. CFBP 2040]NKI73333.1 LysR family transcriptional regulator [Dickeya sp. CFBP 2040]
MLKDGDLTFRKLEIFKTFMETGNITRTAELLGLSGVSVHRALHTLEESVRCPLFIHKGRNLVALPAAHTLLEYSQEAMLLMKRGLEETRKTAGVGQGRLRIGTLYSLTLETVPRLIMGIKLRRPDLELDLTMGSNQRLLAMLDDQQLDAILISLSDNTIDRNQLEFLPLFEDDICLAAPASVKLDTHQPADLRDFHHQQFVSLSEGFATYAGFQEAFHIAGFEPEIVTRVDDIFSMLSLVQAGIGFTLIPERMKKVYENDVQLLKLAPPYQMRQLIAIVFARNREHDPNLLALVAEGRMYARSLNAAVTPVP